MSDYKLTFKLKQHTPIIHFQHYQYGATLRASELKPKLDKFLIEKFEKDGTKYKPWLVGKGEHPALDYKVKINAINVDNPKISEKDKIPNFFANMGKEFKENPKSFSFSENEVEVILFTTNGIIGKLAELFPKFLEETNFGTRQNKGFGSFYISDLAENDNTIFKSTYYIKVDTTEDYVIYSAIEYYYKRLKAGINNNFNNLCSIPPRCNPNKYKKSYLFKHFNSSTRKGWEKRWIKETFFGLYNDGFDKFFVRALLGVPGSYSYKPTLEPCHKQNDHGIPSSYKIEDNYEIEVTHDIINRFKSPITFKPIKLNSKTHIYIIPDNSFEKLLEIKTPFTFYKKFVANYCFSNRNNQLKFSQEKPFPTIEGTNQKEAEQIIDKLANQEEKLNDLISINNDDQDERRRNKNDCLLIKIIHRQKNRFKKFLLECNYVNGKYYPPNSKIELPGNNIEFDIDTILKNYHAELDYRFTFNFNRSDYNAIIKKTN
ncbi:MAG: hypothetical protein HYS25_08825 [Ignavibacteriales bacterium]|nr:hypothetical protein [Ignavibacteriales bacterium]